MWLKKCILLKKNSYLSTFVHFITFNWRVDHLSICCTFNVSLIIEFMFKLLFHMMQQQNSHIDHVICDFQHVTKILDDKPCEMRLNVVETSVIGLG